MVYLCSTLCYKIKCIRISLLSCLPDKHTLIGFSFKVPLTRIFFLHKYLAYHMFKPIPIKNKISNNFKLGFSGLKVLLFCVKSVPCTGNEFAGYDVENCESSQW